MSRGKHRKCGKSISSHSLSSKYFVNEFRRLLKSDRFHHPMTPLLWGAGIGFLALFYMTYIVPRDGVVDIRESFLSVLGIFGSCVLILCPLWKIVWAFMRTMFILCKWFVYNYVFEPLRRWFFRRLSAKTSSHE